MCRVDLLVLLFLYHQRILYHRPRCDRWFGGTTTHLLLLLNQRLLLRSKGIQIVLRFCLLLLWRSSTLAFDRYQIAARDRFAIPTNELCTTSSPSVTPTDDRHVSQSSFSLSPTGMDDHGMALVTPHVNRNRGSAEKVNKIPKCSTLAWRR